MKPIEIIVAVDKYGGFGKNGKIPWNFPADMKHFREVTTGGICIMGRVTHQDMVEMAHARRIETTKKKVTKKKTAKKKDIALAERPRITKILANRECFVITSNREYDAQGATPAPSLRVVMDSIPNDDQRTVFVIGGGKLFTEALAWANKVHVTVIPEGYDCDRHFPLNYLTKNFRVSGDTKVDELMFVTYHRVAK